LSNGIVIFLPGGKWNSFCARTLGLVFRIHKEYSYGMNTTRFHLRFTDEGLANALTKAKPPEGVKVTVSPAEARASQDAAPSFHVTIEFPHTGSIEADLARPKSALAAVSGWVATELHAQAANRDDKTASINGDIITLDRAPITRLIRKDVTTQIKREGQLAGRGHR
jgi:hypothetical protein